MDLRHGEFFGREVAAERVGGFALSLTRYDRLSSIPWHAHEEMYVTFVLRGAYRERLRGGTRDCAPRSALVHPAGERHADEFTSSAVCLNVQPESAWLRAVAGRGADVDAPAMVTTLGVSEIAARLSRELRHCDALSPMVIEGLMLELFAETARHSSTRRVPAWLSAVHETIAAQFTTRLSIASLAASAGVHPVHLAR